MRHLFRAAMLAFLLAYFLSSGCGGTGGSHAGTNTTPTSIAAEASAKGPTTPTTSTANETTASTEATSPSDAGPTPHASRLLPIDPNIKMGKLSNGMKYWIRSHKTPPGKVGIWLHVGSGSVNESEDQRGLAHFLEHLAFNGSENFPAGTLVKYFESIGLTFGRHQNAFTGFDQTTYIITLPNTENETVGKGLLCLADFAFRMSLLDEEIEKERGVVLEEMRARKGARQRILDDLLPILLPGSRVAERLPIGKEEVLQAARRDRFVAYYKKWYRPGDSTLLIVGDIDVSEVENQVADKFGPWPAVENPSPNEDLRIRPYAETRAAVLTDPELTQTEVSAVSVRPLEKFETVGDFRRRQVDRFGTWILNRRFSEMVQKGTAPFQKATVSKSAFLNVCTYIDVEATGEPDQWAPMMKSMLTEIRRVHEHGFLEQELVDAKKSALALAKQAARVESTRNARSFLHGMNRAVSRMRKPMSRAQGLELMRTLLPSITLEEVAAAFRKNYAPEARLLLVTMPEKEDLRVPSEEDVVAVARDVDQIEVTAKAAKERPTRLLEKDPAPGAVARQSEDPDLKILSVTFENGVRVHLRQMDFKKNQVLAILTVAGGTIQETPAIRGVSSVAALALAQPAGAALSSTDIRDLMTGKSVTVSGGAGPDAFVLQISGSPEDLEEGFRLAHLLLTSPRVEAAALALWKKQLSQRIERRRTSVEGQLSEQVSALMSSNDPRFRFLTKKQVEAQGLEEGQAWLDTVIRNGPIEAAIVGDMDRDRALKLASRYLGSLPARPNRASAIADLRDLAPFAGPLEKLIEVDTITPRAAVRLAWRGADWTDVKYRRTLGIAAQILQGRLREEIREKRGLTYSIACFSNSSREYRGAGLFQVHFTADPAKAAETARITRELVEKFAREGPTEDEMATVRKQFKNIIETAQKTPRYWASVLSDLDYHGTRLADVKEALEKYTTYTREDLMTSMQKCVTETNRIQVIARPKKTGDE